MSVQESSGADAKPMFMKDNKRNQVERKVM